MLRLYIKLCNICTLSSKWSQVNCLKNTASQNLFVKYLKITGFNWKDRLIQEVLKVVH